MTRVRFIIVSVASVLTPDTVRPKISAHYPTVFESLKRDCPPADHLSAILFEINSFLSYVRIPSSGGLFLQAHLSLHINELCMHPLSFFFPVRLL